MHSCLVGLDAIKAAGPRVKGLILSGGPASVYESDAPHLHVRSGGLWWRFY
jgi:GMP synthase-like glutamine amidotransferase